MSRTEFFEQGTGLTPPQDRLASSMLSFTDADQSYATTARGHPFMPLSEAEITVL